MQITIEFLFLFCGIVHAYNCGDKVRHLSAISSPIISMSRHMYLTRIVSQDCWAPCVCAYCYSSGSAGSEMVHYCLDLVHNRDVCGEPGLCPNCATYIKPLQGALSFSESPSIDQVSSRDFQVSTCDQFPAQFRRASDSSLTLGEPISGGIALALVGESATPSGEEPIVLANLDEVYTPPNYYPIPWFG